MALLPLCPIFHAVTSNGSSRHTEQALWSSGDLRASRTPESCVEGAKNLGGRQETGRCHSTCCRRGRRGCRPRVPTPSLPAVEVHVRLSVRPSVHVCCGCASLPHCCWAWPHAVPRPRGCEQTWPSSGSHCARLPFCHHSTSASRNGTQAETCRPAAAPRRERGRADVLLRAAHRSARRLLAPQLTAETCPTPPTPCGVAGPCRAQEEGRARLWLTREGTVGG